MRWTADALRTALGTDGSADGAGFTGISTDTRTIEPGSLFVALAGERFDGHGHLAEARERGAAAALVRRGTAAVAGLRLIEVDDPLAAYGRLARARRSVIPGPVVAITGTNGKTSTKEMVAAVLRTRYRVHATRANLNNLVGVPLTILEAPEGTEALVVEAGASVPGEIARYRDIIEPTIALVTNVGSGHLEGFGSREGVMREKLSLVRGTDLAIVGTDPPELAPFARSLAQRVVVAGLAEADVVPRDLTVDALGRASFDAGGVHVRLPLPGKHLAANAMLAWAVVEELGLDREAAALALSSLSVPGGRSELSQYGGLTVVNDSYNANPESFRSAIATAHAMRGQRRLVFVAGTMRELGAYSAALHADVARDLADLAPDLLAVVGEFVPAMAPFADRLGDRLLTAPDPPALGPALAARLHGDEIVVLKASRGVALERILPFLVPPHTTSPEG